MRKRISWIRFSVVVSAVALGTTLWGGTLESAATQSTLSSRFSAVVKQALPAVVNVSSSKTVTNQASQSPYYSDPFLRQFFGGQFNAPQQRREHGLGSGVIVSPDGYILTNNHVVDGADDIKVMLGDNREFEAKVVGTDAKTDIAVLKVDATDLPVLSFGDSTEMVPGDVVLAIGNPFGLNQTVTMGIVSATGRGGLGIEDYEDFIQTDAAINPGNSGGALISENGQLIGINTAILSGGGGGNEGVGFAIPINMARQVMDQILDHGHVVRAWLGVTIQPVTSQIAKAFDLTDVQGALVGDVAADSPAAKADLRTGDIIVDLNGTPVDSSRSLQLQVAMMKPGTTVNLDVMRSGVRESIPVTLGEMPTTPNEGSEQISDNSGALDGVSVETLTPEIAQELQLPATTRGVVISEVDPSSAAAEAGLQRGDVIEQVNRVPTPDYEAFAAQMQRAGNAEVLLLVNRGGSTTFVVVEP